MRGLLALVLLTGGATRLPIAASGYAYWTWDGAGFFMVENDERMLRFDAAGKVVGRVSLVPLGKLAALEAHIMSAGRAVSPDGKSLLLIAQMNEGGGSAPFVVDVATGAARRVAVEEGMTTQAEWLADGRIIGAQFGHSQQKPFIAGREQAAKPLCPQVSPWSVHAHPDGKRLGLAADRFYISDLDCHVQITLSAVPRAIPRDFAFSPSGDRVAVVFVLARPHALPERHLWILSLDGMQSMDTGATPEIGPLAWLDEYNLVYPVENGEKGTNRRTLQRLSWRERKTSALVTPVPSCDDSDASAPARGGRVLFRRMCDEPKGSGVFSVRAD